MAHQGEVKSFNDGKGWGFIQYDGCDVFIHVNDCTDGRPVKGDRVCFDLEEDTKRRGQKKALNVSGCTGAKPGGGVGDSIPPAGLTGCSGSVKTFNDQKGWGFINYEGADVFVHVNDCIPSGGKPAVGDWLTFEVQTDSVRGRGQLKATNVRGATGRTDGSGGGSAAASWGGSAAADGGYGQMAGYGLMMPQWVHPAAGYGDAYADAYGKASTKRASWGTGPYGMMGMPMMGYGIEQSQVAAAEASLAASAGQHASSIYGSAGQHVSSIASEVDTSQL